MTLKGITVAPVPDGSCWVRARFTVGPHQFIAQWQFASQGEAEAFADDPPVVLTAGIAALEAVTSGTGQPPDQPQPGL